MTNPKSRLKRKKSQHFYNPATPLWLEPHYEDLWALFFVCFTGMVVHDAVVNGIGSANGRFVSLVDTVDGICGYRTMLPKQSKRMTLLRFIWIASTALLMKFASGTLVSVLLGEVPVILKGWRHIAFFFLGFCISWLFPGDVVYTNMRRSDAVKFMVALTCGLYKLRKSLFAVETCIHIGFELVYTSFIVLLVLDGSTLVTTSVLWFEAQLLSLSMVNFSQQLKQGLSHFFVHKMLPDITVATMIWITSPPPRLDVETPFAIEVRVTLLMYFIWRQNSFLILAKIHNRSTIKVKSE